MNKKKFSHTRKNETERIFRVFEDLRAIKRTRQFAKEEEKKKDEVKKNITNRNGKIVVCKEFVRVCQCVIKLM